MGVLGQRRLGSKTGKSDKFVFKDSSVLICDLFSELIFNYMVMHEYVLLINVEQYDESEFPAGHSFRARLILRGRCRYQCIEDPSRTYPVCSRACRVMGRCFVGMYVYVLFGQLPFFNQRYFLETFDCILFFVAGMFFLLSFENISGSGFPLLPLDFCHVRE